jgi:hypothetical protein
MNDREIDDLELGKGWADGNGKVLWYGVANRNGKEYGGLTIRRQNIHDNRVWYFECPLCPKHTETHQPGEDSAKDPCEALDKLRKHHHLQNL